MNEKKKKSEENSLKDSKESVKRDAAAIERCGYYEVPEVAELLGVSDYTVMCYLRDGRMKGVKAGGRWIVSFRNYQRFIDGETE